MENNLEQFNQEALEISSLNNYRNAFQNEILDIDFEEEVSLDALIERIETNEVDKIFKEIKSSIIN